MIYSKKVTGPIKDLDFPTRSLLFADLSSIAYSDKKTATKLAKTLGFSTVEFYDRDGAQAYRFQNKHDLVIACRGTQPTQFSDIAADLKAYPVKSETVSRVHRGFKSEVDDLWPMVLEDITRTVNKDNKLWFTGHSLGAAMATIMASRCFYEKSIRDPEELYTYGSPRAGWPGYVKTMAVKHHRWVNNNDIVTTVPPSLIGYKHDGERHYLNAFGNVRKPTAWQLFKDRLRGLWRGIKQGKIDSFSDHSIELYALYLKMYADGKENSQR
jgi:triacylglycerol lipase